MASTTLDGSDNAAKILEKYPLGLGRVEDVAATVKFLVSDEARWITGQHFVVDGGRTAN
jgi:NAD(P)-dependent dehydrogenase (short-subunit alcohol dehydrogenase family)